MTTPKFSRWVAAGVGVVTLLLGPAALAGSQYPPTTDGTTEPTVVGGNQTNGGSEVLGAQVSNTGSGLAATGTDAVALAVIGAGAVVGGGVLLRLRRRAGQPA